MTTRTLTVQADQRAYVPHALCIVKRTSFAMSNLIRNVPFLLMSKKNIHAGIVRARMGGAGGRGGN